MKIMKLGLIVVLFLGLSACFSTDKEPIDVPVLSDEKIKADAFEFTSYVTQYESIEALTYTIDKISSTRWTITGQLSLKTAQCTINGPFTMVYAYKDSKWTLGAHTYTPATLINITLEPDPKDAQELVYQSIIAQEGYTTYPFEDIVLVDHTVVMNIGQANFIFTYNLIEGPASIEKTVEVNGIFTYQNGWTYALGNSTFKTNIEWTHDFHFVWDILENETHFSNNEITEVYLQGMTTFSGGNGLNTVLTSTSLTAYVIINGEQFAVTPQPVTDENGLNKFKLKLMYGLSMKDALLLVYGASDYKGIQTPMHYYLISADQSQAK